MSSHLIEPNPNTRETNISLHIGMVGAGQLARMSHQASIPLGVDLSVLAAHADDSAALISPRVTIGSPHSARDLIGFAAGAEVITFDHELVNLEALAQIEAEQSARVRPSSAALKFATDKAHQRRLFAQASLPLPKHSIVSHPGEAKTALAELGWQGVIKTARGGYDGRGVWLVDSEAEATALLEEFSNETTGFPELIVEEIVPLVKELAVIVVRGANGMSVTYPVTETVQVSGICRETITPAVVSPEIAAEAVRVSVAAAQVVDAVGLTAVELFFDGTNITINEVATRPHNSGHWSIEGAITSQFENHLRAVAGLPLGATSCRAPYVVSCNILGHSTGLDPRQQLPQALGISGAHVHLYGKEPKPGRKIGHVTTMSDSLEDAQARARRAVGFLGDAVPLP